MQVLKVREGRGEDPPVLPVLPDEGVAHRHLVRRHLSTDRAQRRRHRRVCTMCECPHTGRARNKVVSCSFEVRIFMVPARECTAGAPVVKKPATKCRLHARVNPRGRWWCFNRVGEAATDRFAVKNNQQPAKYCRLASDKLAWPSPRRPYSNDKHIGRDTRRERERERERVFDEEIAAKTTI